PDEDVPATVTSLVGEPLAAQTGTGRTGMAPSLTTRTGTGQTEGRPLSASARRAQVMRASRSYNRTAIRSRDQLAREAARDAAERAQSLSDLYEKAAERSDQIEWMTRWVVPVSHYQITATFGDYSGLWSSYHTGLDFAAPEGTPVMATAMGEVTSTTY